MRNAPTHAHRSKSYLSEVDMQLVSPRPPSHSPLRRPDLGKLRFADSQAAGALHVKSGSAEQKSMRCGGRECSSWLSLLVTLKPDVLLPLPGIQEAGQWRQLLVQTLIPGPLLRVETLQLPGESRNSCGAGSCTI